jgi:hypothetical protein
MYKVNMQCYTSEHTMQVIYKLLFLHFKYEIE